MAHMHGSAEGEVAYLTTTTLPTRKCSSASSLTSMPKPGASGTVTYPSVWEKKGSVRAALTG